MEAAGVPARQQAVREVTDRLRAMEAGGDGAAVLEGLRALGDLAGGMMPGWLGRPNADGFHFYHAARNVTLVLDGMTERLAAGGDPDIARDALAVMPLIDASLGAAGARDISEESIKAVVDGDWVMLDAAEEANLDGPLVRDMETADWSLINDNAEAVMKYLGMRTRDGYSPDD